jgi:hypothetical protein
LAVLKVVLPVSFVLSSIDVHVDSISVGFIVFPLSFVDVTVSMPELAAAVCFIFSPLSLVLGIIWPDLDSRTMSHIIDQISLVDSSILKSQFLDELEALFMSIPL